MLFTLLFLLFGTYSGCFDNKNQNSAEKSKLKF